MKPTPVQQASERYRRCLLEACFGEAKSNGGPSTVHRILHMRRSHVHRLHVPSRHILVNHNLVLRTSRLHRFPDLAYGKTRQDSSEGRLSRRHLLKPATLTLDHVKHLATPTALEHPEGVKEGSRRFERSTEA